MNEKGEVVSNTSKLVFKGYSLEGDIDYKEKYAPPITMEEVRMFLAYVVNKKFKVSQINFNLPFSMENLKKRYILRILKVFFYQKTKTWYSN